MMLNVLTIQLKRIPASHSDYFLTLRLKSATGKDSGRAGQQKGKEKKIK